MNSNAREVQKKKDKERNPEGEARPRPRPPIVARKGGPKRPKR